MTQVKTTELLLNMFYNLSKNWSTLDTLVKIYTRRNYLKANIIQGK